jgi:uncharacterized protein YqeY
MRAGRWLFSSISSRIEQEVILAMRAKDTLRVSTLRNLKSRITYKLKDVNAPKELDDNAVLVLIKQSLVRRKKTFLCPLFDTV